MGRSQINIRVDNDQKEEWQSAVDESNEYKSLTHLIELAVTRELNGDRSDMVAATGGGSDDSGVSNGDLLDVIQTLRQQIKQLQTEVNRLGRESSETFPLTLLKPILEKLPTDEANAVPPSEVATGMEYATEESMANALAELDDATDVVESMTMAGITHYYKNE